MTRDLMDSVYRAAVEKMKPAPQAQPKE